MATNEKENWTYESFFQETIGDRCYAFDLSSHYCPRPLERTATFPARALRRSLFGPYWCLRVAPGVVSKAHSPFLLLAPLGCCEEA